MSNTSFDFLTESFLFHEAEIKYRDRTVDEISEELDRYRNHIASNIDSLNNEINRSSINILQAIKQQSVLPDMDTILQGALFLDTFLIDDPIFSFSVEQIKRTNVAKFAMNMAEKESDDDIKEQLSEFALYMRDLTPGVCADTQYIKFYPFYFLIYPPMYSYIRIPDLSTNEMGDEILKWFSDRLIVENLDKENRTSDIEFSNKIVLPFKDDIGSHCVIAQYQLMSAEEIIGNHALVKFDYNYIPRDDEYRNWVQQERIKAIKDKFNFFLVRNALCESFNSPVILNNNFEKDFYETIFGETTEAHAHTLGFEINIPSLQKIDFESAMEVRSRVKDGFKAFQEQIKSDSIQLITATDEKLHTEVIHALEVKYIEGMKSIESVLSVSKQIAQSNIIPWSITAFSYFTETDMLKKGVVTGLSLLESLLNIRKEIKDRQKNPFYFLNKISGRKR